MTDRDLVHAAYPSAADPRPDAERAARDALLARIAHRPRRRPAWRLVVPVAAAGAIAALVALGPVSGLLDEAGPGRADAAAVRALDAVAAVAEARPAAALAAPTAGRFAYTRTRSIDLTNAGGGGEPVSALVPTARELWLGEDGSMRIRDHVGAPLFLTARDRAAWRALGLREEPHVVEHAEPAGTYVRPWTESGITDAEIERLASDPEALAGRLREAAGGSGPSPEQEMFVIVGDVMRSGPVSPAARAALYRAAAYIPGVTLVGGVRDSLGRPGLAVAFRADGVREELVFDPETSALLAERRVLESPVAWLPGVPAGTVIGESAIIGSRLVDAADVPRITRGAEPPKG